MRTAQNYLKDWYTVLKSGTADDGRIIAASHVSEVAHFYQNFAGFYPFVVS